VPFLPDYGDNRGVPRAHRTKCGRLVVASEAPGLLGVEFLLRRLRTTIGRVSNETNDIVLPHRSVSRTHAVITRDAETGRYAIADQRSTNGVRVNGNQYGKVELRAGDYIDLGWVRFRFVASDELFLAMSRSLLKLERRLLGDHYAAFLREATVASVFS
jgi:ABC transport system ATP-binding/permease protein